VPVNRAIGNRVDYQKFCWITIYLNGTLNYQAIASGQEYVNISSWEIKTHDAGKLKNPRRKLQKRRQPRRLTWYSKLLPARNT
jgi:hypothetical protein